VEYVKFSLLFIFSHVVAYTFAGVIALKVSKEIYENKSRHCDFLRDMSNKEESMYVSKCFLPAQILRGFLMSIVLLPILNSLLELSFVLQVTFFCSLMFIYTHISAVSPFIDNIEGFVYFKKQYIKKNIIVKFQFEMVMYSILFSLFLGILLRITY